MVIVGNTVSELEAYELARKQIEHEDTLSNNRANWLMVFQGFLLTALTGALGLYEKFQTYGYVLAPGILCLAGVGIVASVVAFFATRAGLQHTLEVRQWWNTQGLGGFPPVSGNQGFGIGPWTLHTSHFHLVFVAVWIVFVRLLWIAAVG